MRIKTRITILSATGVTENLDLYLSYRHLPIILPQGETEPIPILGTRNDFFAQFWAVISNQVHRVSMGGQYLCDPQNGVTGVRF